VKRALACFCLLAFAACGYHDTPVATYEGLAAGTAGLAGAGASAVGGAASGSSGLGGNLGQAGSLVADAGNAGASPDGPLCWQTYPLVVAGLTSHYKQGEIRQNWVDAERDCEAEGGHLIVIDDDVENTWLAQIAEQSLTNEKSSHQLAWRAWVITRRRASSVGSRARHSRSGSGSAASQTA
jgi:hypothetical protein